MATPQSRIIDVPQRQPVHNINLFGQKTQPAFNPSQFSQSGAPDLNGSLQFGASPYVSQNTVQDFTPASMVTPQQAAMAAPINKTSIGSYTPQMVDANTQLQQLGVNAVPGQTNGLMGDTSVPDVIDKTPGMTGIDKANLGMNILQLGMAGYFGNENLSLARDQFKADQRAYNDTYRNQRSEVNRNLYERQQWRNAQGTHLAGDTQEYMQQWGIA